MQIDDVSVNYRKSTKRLLLLDYDGTLAPLAPTPPEAAPTAELLQMLEVLSADSANTVVIVSGRLRNDLDEWLGDLPLSFAAEHGFWHRTPGQPWQTALTEDLSWQQKPKAVMEAAVTAVEGSFIESKYSGLVWHYRQARDQKQAQHTAEQLLAQLETQDESQPYIVFPGSMNVEVQLIGADKGLAVQQWLMRQEWDFILVAGDDTTDEAMFRAVPETAFSIKVGGGQTAARLRLAAPAELVALLNQLATSID